MNATIGALIMTNQPEHGFDQTNNGYFACWAGVCAALGNIGVDAIKNGEDIAKKGVSPAWGIIISSIMVLRTNAARLELAAPCQRRPAPCSRSRGLARLGPGARSPSGPVSRLRHH